MLQSVLLSHFPWKKPKKTEQNPIGAAPSIVPLSTIGYVLTRACEKMRRVNGVADFAVAYVNKSIKPSDR